MVAPARFRPAVVMRTAVTPAACIAITPLHEGGHGAPHDRGRKQRHAAGKLKRKTHQQQPEPQRHQGSAEFHQCVGRISHD